MTKFANVSFTTQEAPKPEGVVVGGFSVSLTQAGLPIGTPVVLAASGPVQFTVAVAGDYTVQVVRVAESGEAISAVVESAAFNVPQEMILVPFEVTVTLSDSMDVPAVVAVAVA
jgi:hypothetical protein